MQEELKISDIDIFDDLDDDFEDPYYIAPTEEEEAFAEDIFNFLQSEIDKADRLHEEFIHPNSLSQHFNKHCIGKSKDKISSHGSIYYDFTDNSQYREYEKSLMANLRSDDPNITRISSLLETEEVADGFSKLFEGNKYLVFNTLSGFRNRSGPVVLVFHSFASDVTKNYIQEDTIDLMILTPKYKTISLYPVAASYLETKFNNIIKKYHTLDTSFKINH